VVRHGDRGVIAVFGRTFLDQEIGDPLYVLPANAERARDLRYRVRSA
jgi:hypothetical protein